MRTQLTEHEVDLDDALPLVGLKGIEATQWDKGGNFYLSVSFKFGNVDFTIFTKEYKNKREEKGIKNKDAKNGLF